MSIWFALGYDGELYNLCDCGDMEAAEESAADVIPDMEGQVTNSKAIWLFDEHTAAQWVEVLVKGISMNSKLKVTDVEVPSGSEESDSPDHQMYLRLNGIVDLKVQRTGEGYVVDLFRVPPNDDILDSVATTWVHDNDLIDEEGN